MSFISETKSVFISCIMVRDFIVKKILLGCPSFSGVVCCAYLKKSLSCFVPLYYSQPRAGVMCCVWNPFMKPFLFLLHGICGPVVITPLLPPHSPRNDSVLCVCVIPVQCYSTFGQLQYRKHSSNTLESQSQDTQSQDESRLPICQQSRKKLKLYRLCKDATYTYKCLYTCM